MNILHHIPAKYQHVSIVTASAHHADVMLIMTHVNQSCHFWFDLFIRQYVILHSVYLTYNGIYQYPKLALRSCDIDFVGGQWYCWCFSKLHFLQTSLLNTANFFFSYLSLLLLHFSTDFTITLLVSIMVSFRFLDQIQPGVTGRGLVCCKKE